MKTQHVKQVREALGHVLNSVTNEKVLSTDQAVKFTTAFSDRNNEPFTFYGYMRPGSKKIFLTDAGLILAVVDMSDRPLWERISSLFQAWNAADGVLRTWTRPKG
jgi:hypothetical protein